MDIDTRCQVCWRLDEYGGHYFLKCKYVKECWRALDLEEERIRLTGLSSAMQVSAHVLSLSEENKLLIVGLIWSWWDARNKANAGEPRRTTEEVIYRARVVTQQLSNATTAEDMQMVRTCAPRWTPPPPDIWKINVDAACWAKEMDGAWGFVIRDHHGSAVLAGAGRLEVVCDALCAESHACIEALQVAADHGMQRVIVETDSQTLVKALQSDVMDWAPSGVLFREAKFIMATSFTSVEILYVLRSCNFVAHGLTRVGRRRDLGYPALWMNPLPALVNDLLMRELAESQVHE